MSIVKSQDITGTLTHWSEHCKSICKEGFTINKRSVLLNKPNGVWISWNGGWEQYVKDYFPSWMTATTLSVSVKIKPDLNIWLIDSYEDFMHMWNQSEFKNINPKNTGLHLIRFWTWLCEQRINGIALTDKGQRETRIVTFLSGWDCASIIIFLPENVEVDDEQN